MQLAGHEPEKRAILYDFIVYEMTALAKLHPHRISSIATSLTTQRDALLDVAHTLSVELSKLTDKYQQPTELLWRICYAMRYSVESNTYHEKTSELEALVGSQYDALEDEVLTLLEHTHRCSSMVENFNSRLRPYLDEQKLITQKILSLIQFYLNHKPFMRSKHECLKKKSPAEALTGKDPPHWLVMLGFSPF